jgi:hypothetical protein
MIQTLQSNMRGDLRAAFKDLLDPRLVSLLYARLQAFPTRTGEEGDTQMELDSVLHPPSSSTGHETPLAEEIPQTEMAGITSVNTEDDDRYLQNNTTNVLQSKDLQQAVELIKIYISSTIKQLNGNLKDSATATTQTPSDDRNLDDQSLSIVKHARPLSRIDLESLQDMLVQPPSYLPCIH